MNFVIVEKNQKSAPTDNQLTNAMVKSGGTVSSVHGTNSKRTVEYTRTVNHNKFQNELEKKASGDKLSWNFIWGDAMTMALKTAENHNLSDSDYSRSVFILNNFLAATRKSVIIKIDPNDFSQLKNSKYRLCYAKKVGDNDYNVVWQSYIDFLVSNTFSWTPQYELFGSNYFQGDVQVDVSTNVIPISLGQSSILDANGLLGTASTGGPTTGITMNNQYGPIHPSINQISTGIKGKTYSTPIYVAQNEVVKGNTILTPVEKILVWFEQDIETSTMFSNSRSLDVEIDLTTTDSATRLYTNGAWITPSSV